jgi:single-stranded DNA-binding protein
MQLCINRVILAGQVGRDGVEIRYNERGTAHASFMLVLTDVGQDGREHATWIPCEVWGKGAEKAGELDAGQSVCFEGKLRRQKRGESWETVIAGFEVNPVGESPSRVS